MTYIHCYVLYFVYLIIFFIIVAVHKAIKVTPTNISKELISLPINEMGVLSPKPTVTYEVIEKYIELTNEESGSKLKL